MNNKYYCRKCLSFIGEEANKEYFVNDGDYCLNYNLTDDQFAASDFILNNIKNNRDCAINAVCGAGKTEIVYKALQYCLSGHKRVGIAIPRRDVVIELQQRLSKDFNVSVVGVYGGNTNLIEGDIIVFTTHQAYRYLKYFDVLIIDEVDAFPFKGNLVLQNIVSNCSKVFVYLSATMPKYIENNKKIDKFHLNKRYHGFDLPVPIIKRTFFVNYELRKLLNKYRNKVVLVYFPTIKKEIEVAKKFKPNIVVNSKTDNRDDVLCDIRSMEEGCVFTTTILERGITIKDVQVIVYEANHKLYDCDTLIQISGRVGRNKDFPYGDVIFLCKKKGKELMKAISKIKEYNE